MSEYLDNKQLFSSPKVGQYNNHMVMTNVVKPLKTKHIFIDTKFCDDKPNVPPSNPEYNLCNYNLTLSDRITDVKTMTVKGVEIPMTFYNISSSIGNNFFKVSIAASSSIITIPDGQYNIEELKNIINNIIGAVIGLPNPLTYNNSTTNSTTNNKSSFTATTSSNITIDFAVDKTGNFDKYNLKTKLGWVLGFRNISYIVKSGIPIHSEANINLNVFRYLLLAVDELSNGSQDSIISVLPKSRINKNIIAKICVDNKLYPYGTVLNANSQIGYLISDTRNYTGNKVDIQKLNIQLLDDTGNPINLNGADFSFSLKIEHE